jgi:hypothetical protein
MSKKEQNKAQKNAKNSRTSGGVCKLPAGTPKAKKEDVYTATQTQDPPVPNRAHTEM